MLNPTLNKWLAVFELLLAALFWGFGFIAAIWAMPTLDPFELTFLRFLLAAIFGLPFIILRGAQWRLSFLPALFLAGTLVFQTWGLQFTTATKSGFITTLYVVFVPLLDAFVARKKLPLALWLCVFLAFLGTALIVDLQSLHVNLGDGLTFVCALLATGQIFWMGLIAKKIRQPFCFNLCQSYWSLIFCLPLVHLQGLEEKITHVATWPTKAVLGLLFLAFGSTVLAFYLQVRAQSRLSATVSSLMFLLESPFALIFAMIFLQQGLSRAEAVGALLIFGAAFFSTRLEAPPVTQGAPA